MYRPHGTDRNEQPSHERFLVFFRRGQSRRGYAIPSSVERLSADQVLASVHRSAQYQLIRLNTIDGAGDHVFGSAPQPLERPYRQGACAWNGQVHHRLLELDVILAIANQVQPSILACGDCSDPGNDARSIVARLHIDRNGRLEAVSEDGHREKGNWCRNDEVQPQTIGQEQRSKQVHGDNEQDREENPPPTKTDSPALSVQGNSCTHNQSCSGKRRERCCHRPQPEDTWPELRNYLRHGTQRNHESRRPNPTATVGRGDPPADPTSNLLRLTEPVNDSSCGKRRQDEDAKRKKNVTDPVSSTLRCLGGTDGRTIRAGNDAGSLAVSAAE